MFTSLLSSPSPDSERVSKRSNRSFESDGVSAAAAAELDADWLCGPPARRATQSVHLLPRETDTNLARSPAGRKQAFWTLQISLNRAGAGQMGLVLAEGKTDVHERAISAAMPISPCFWMCNLSGSSHTRRPLDGAVVSRKVQWSWSSSGANPEVFVSQDIRSARTHKDFAVQLIRRVMMMDMYVLVWVNV